MNAELGKHLSHALEEYTTGIHYETLLEAKEEYFEKTGNALEEDEDYENRMNSFNDWYILQFISKRGTRTVIKDYLEKNQVEDQLCHSLMNSNHSLFEYTGTNFKGCSVLKDILHDDKVTLPKEHPPLSLLKNDIFLGRVLTHEDEQFLMNGICILPKDAKSILKKQSKKVRKLKDPSECLTFLLEVEALKTKWTRYGFIDVPKIFVFKD